MRLSYYCLFAPHIWWCCSSRTSRSWWIRQSTQHHRRVCNNNISFVLHYSRGYSGRVITPLLRSEIPSGICAKLRTVAASNNRDHMPWSLYYCLFAPHNLWLLFFTHIPFVVNHTFNATPPERLQHPHCWKRLVQTTGPISSNLKSLSFFPSTGFKVKWNRSGDKMFRTVAHPCIASTPCAECPPPSLVFSGTFVYQVATSGVLTSYSANRQKTFWSSLGREYAGDPRTRSWGNDVTDNRKCKRVVMIYNFG